MGVVAEVCPVTCVTSQPANSRKWRDELGGASGREGGGGSGVGRRAKRSVQICEDRHRLHKFVSPFCLVLSVNKSAALRRAYDVRESLSPC